MSNTLKPQAMKRLLTIGLMLATALAFTNCSEQFVSPDQENDIIIDGTVDTPQDEAVRTPFEFFVEEPETKTISNGQSTFWVSEAIAKENGLEVDRVNLFSKAVEDGTGFMLHGKHTYAGNQRFAGELIGTIGETNDWYCIYPYHSSTVVENGAISANVVIGGTKITTNKFSANGPQSNDYVIQYQDLDGSKRHIAGNNYPMYGKTRSPKGTKPTFTTVNHMSSLVALKIKNDGHGGDIVIRNAELRAPESIVGEFKATITDEGVTYTDLNASRNAKIELSDAVTIPANETATLYLAVKPFTVKAKGKLSILVNNSIKTVTLPEQIEFKAGKITTLTVSINKLVHTTESDGKAFLGAMENCTTGLTATINGKTVNDVMIIGSKDEPGHITIQGKLLEVINSLPIGFYATSYNGEQGNLIVDKVVASMSVLGYGIDVTMARKELATKINKPESFFVIAPYPVGSFADDINGPHNLTITDEEPLQKMVDEDKADTFVESYGVNVDTVRKCLSGTATDAEETAFVDILCAFSSKVQTARDLAKYLGGDGLICSMLKNADCAVTLRTAAVGEEGATDPRIVMWGLDIKGAN